MKKIITLVCVAAFFCSCKKNGTSSSQAPPTNGQYYLSSARTVAPQYQIIDSFLYDAYHNVTTILIYESDTLGGQPEGDSIRMDFTIGGNSLPASYVFTDYGSGPLADTHQLTYDGQNRIIKDTSVSGSGFVNYFSYPGTKITSTQFFDGNPYDDNLIDTFTIANGNISNWLSYGLNDAGTDDTVLARLNIGFSAYLNPAYNPQVSTTVGPLLYTLIFDYSAPYYDFISHNVWMGVSGFTDDLPPSGVHYSIVADAKGRVAQLIYSSIAGSSKILFNYYP